MITVDTEYIAEWAAGVKDDDYFRNEPWQLAREIIDEGMLWLSDRIQLVVHEFTDDEPGFVFGLRPSAFGQGHVSVCGMFVESQHLEPRDSEGRLAIDGGVISVVDGMTQLAQNMANEFNALLPAYEKLFGGVE